MIRFLVRVAVYLASAAIGLLFAKAVLSGMTISWKSFLFVVVVFAVVQALLSPLFERTARRRAPALTGLMGLVTTFVALLVADILSSGFTMTGVSTWFWATLIVWLVTLVAAFVLPLLLVRSGVEAARERRA